MKKKVNDDVAQMHKKHLKQVKVELLKSLKNYQKTMNVLACDAPISALCLPKALENALLNAGFLRIYEILNLDLTEIKGIGKTRRNLLASRLNEFVSI